jgi:hypothetical protein
MIFFGKKLNFVDKRFENLEEVAKQYRDEYKNAKPFPGIVFENFFDAEMLDTVLAEFPDLSTGKSSRYDKPNAIKYEGKRKRFGKTTSKFTKYLNSAEFVNFLQTLTGIEEKILPDNDFKGGGLHEIKKGGLLKIHVDFNKHSKKELDRRINILIYLNKNWKEEYGGHLELWNKSMDTCERKVLPVFNTMVIFSTTDFSYHGHPNPLTCPEDMSRKSLALYYYSDGRPASEINPDLHTHGTVFQARKDNDSDRATITEGSST